MTLSSDLVLKCGLNVPQYQGFNVAFELLSLIRHYTITLKSLTNAVKPGTHQLKAGAHLIVLKIDSVQTCIHACVCVCVSTPEATSGVMWCNMNTI